MKTALKPFTYFFRHLFAKFPARLHRIVRHFTDIPANIKKNTPNFTRKAPANPTQATHKNKQPLTARAIASLPILLLGGIVAWVARLSAKIIDLFGLPELVESIAHLLKNTSTRPLSPLEIAEAKRVFADTLPYEQIRIDEKSLIAHTGAAFLRAKQLGVCTFHTINFTRKLQPQPGNTDMAWLIHELTHVAQMQHVGSQYIGEAIYAQLTDGYNYGGPDNLDGKKLADFNREQQADIIRDFYYYVLFDRKFYHYNTRKTISPRPEVYRHYIEQMKGGEF